VIIKFVKWLLIALALTLAAIALVLEIGSRMSMDTDYTHTSATRALPEFSTDSPSGLVRIATDGLEFRARVAGFDTADSRERPAVILLHGFPVTSAMWDPLIKPLTEAGYRVLAFDQRGYSPGARPGDVADYTVEQLVNDVIAVADAAGLEQFHLVGHDWGAIVGWGTVMTYPQRVLSWSALSIAHPAAFSEAQRTDPDQRSRSRYIMLFATPWLPEALFSFKDFALLKSIWSNMPDSARAEYLEVFAEPGALSAAFNWYRAMVGGFDSDGALATEVTTPTLFIWGNEDIAAGRWAVDAQAQYMAGRYEFIELDAGHWLMEDHPRVVTEAIIQHLQAVEQ
jgi:pimeloyl-ACP methyl ester carboxylesterase